MLKKGHKSRAVTTESVNETLQQVEAVLTKHSYNNHEGLERRETHAQVEI